VERERRRDRGGKEKEWRWMRRREEDGRLTHK
jgi:hypothetical protein